MTGDTARRRVLGIEDYAAILRRRAWLIVVPAVLAPLIGLAISFEITPKYTSRSLLQVEAQVVPSGYVKPIVTEHVTDRMTVLQQRVLSHTRIQDLVTRLGLAAKGVSNETTIEEIRTNVTVTPAYPGSTPNSKATANPKPPRGANSDDVPGFFVNVTLDNPRKAQRVCEEITSMLLDENLKRRQETARATTAFIGRQLDDAKRNLDDLDNRLANFKRLHLGRLPTDVDSNLKILSLLEAQLDANTQALTRGQQDKSFTESLLSQEVAAWKASRVSPNLPSLREQLVTLKNQLVSLQSRYTEDHPDVQKARNDIADVESELKALGASASTNDPPDADKTQIEPAAILHLREQIHQDEGLIARAAGEEMRLKERVDSYQARLSLSPEVEEEYKQLTRDSETAHAIYDGLLTDKNKAEIQAQLEHEQQGEQVMLLDAANLPDTASTPVRWLFMVGGLAGGLAFGGGLTILSEARDKSIRNEMDVNSVLELPMLASVPWVASTAGRESRKTNSGGRILAI